MLEKIADQIVFLKSKLSLLPWKIKSHIIYRKLFSWKPIECFSASPHMLYLPGVLSFPISEMEIFIILYYIRLLWS